MQPHVNRRFQAQLFPNSHQEMEQTVDLRFNPIKAVSAFLNMSSVFSVFDLASNNRPTRNCDASWLMLLFGPPQKAR